MVFYQHLPAKNDSDCQIDLLINFRTMQINLGKYNKIINFKRKKIRGVTQ